MGRSQTDPQMPNPIPGRRRAAFLFMLLAQSGKSQGFGDSVPKGHDWIHDPRRRKITHEQSTSANTERSPHDQR